MFLYDALTVSVIAYETVWASRYLVRGNQDIIQPLRVLAIVVACMALFYACLLLSPSLQKMLTHSGTRYLLDVSVVVGISLLCARLVTDYEKEAPSGSIL